VSHASDRWLRLESEVETLRDRVDELEARRPTLTERPMHEVALGFVRGALNRAGQELSRLQHEWGA